MLAVLTFVLFTAGVAVVSYFYTKGESLDTSDSYFLGGRSLPYGVIAGSIMLTNLSTEHLIGLNGSAFNHGLVVIAWETLAAIALVLLAIVFLPRYLSKGITTIPEYLAKRFDQSTATIATSLFLLLYVFTQLPIVLYSGALALRSIIDIPTFFGSDILTLTLMIWAIGGLGAIYAIFGGLKAVAISDTLNGIGLLCGGLTITFLGLRACGHGDIFVGLQELMAAHPQKFKAIGGEESILPFSTLFTGMITVQVFSWCTNQSFVQRALAAKNLKEGQKGVLLAALLKILGPIIVVLPGIIAFHLYGTSLEKSDLAYPTLVKNLLPPAFMGLFAAILVGTILSTFNSVLNSAATLLAIGIFKPYSTTSQDSKKLIQFGKRSSLFLTLFSLGLAPFTFYAPQGLYFLLQELNSIFTPPLFVVVLMGLFSTRVNAQSAKWVLLGGPLLYIAIQFGLQIELHFLHLVGLLTGFHILSMLFISWITDMRKMRTRPSANQIFSEEPPDGMLLQRNALSFAPSDSYGGKNLETSLAPWLYVKPVSLVVLVFTLSCYLYFS